MRRQLLTIILSFAVFFVPLMMRAESATELAATISGFNGGNSGSLLATADGNIVTVTGTLSNVSSSLMLNIDEGVTVLWKASITTDATFPASNNLIQVDGSGSFEVTTGGNVEAINGGDNVTAIRIVSSDATITVSGGTVSAYFTGIYADFVNEGSVITVSGGVVSSTQGNAITADGKNSTITVCGTGIVEATGDNGIAVNTYGNVEIKDNAQVSATKSLTINAWGESPTVTISGGSVSATTGIAIAAGSNPTIIISGTGKVEATEENGTCINSGSATGSDAIVEIKDDAQVIATTGTAISLWNGNPMLTVSGSGKVEATGDNGTAISSVGKVKIQDNAQVSALGDNGTAIGTGCNVEINDNAQVSATTGMAINGWGESYDITVSGTVSATTGIAINLSGESPTLTISGSGKVEATEDNGIGINSGSAAIVEIKEDAQVSATTGSAVNLWNNETKLTVSGSSKIEATGDNGIAIASNGEVDIKDQAQVVASTGPALDIRGSESNEITISGGIVSSASPERVIVGYNESSLITVCGSGIVEATGDGQAIGSISSVEVKDDAKVTSVSGIAIIVSGENSTIKVSGGTVSSNSSDKVIETYSEKSTITVSGTGKVEATGDGQAIHTAATVQVEDEAQVSAASGTVINIYKEDSEVIVSGTSKVEATGNNIAIVAPNVKVEDEAKVIAATGTAIIGWSENFTVDVSGGVVFAYGDAIDNNVINTSNPDGYTLSGSGIVIAWNPTAGKTYTQGKSDDITWLPETAAAVWDKNGENFGITYTNGTNTGFIPLDVTVVSTACDLTGLDSPAGATINGLMITATVDNSVASQTISVTTSPNASWKLFSNAACTNEITNKTMTLSEGENTAYIQVTAEDGVTKKVYTIVVTREEAIYTPYLYLSSTSMNIPASGGQQILSISSNTKWGIWSRSSGVSFSPDSGDGDGTVTVTVDANPNAAQRTIAVYVTGEDIEDQTISVTQDAAAPALSVSPATLNFPASGAQKTFAISSNTSWTVKSNNSKITISPASGSNNATVTVIAGENTATTQQTATITISGTGVTEQTISVTQDAAEETPVGVEADETKPVGSDGKGSIELSLSIPSNVTLTGSFEIQFPEGMTLDEALTALSPELSGNFSLSFTNKGNNTWLIEIKSNALKNATASEYRNIMNIAYTVDKSVQTGSYDVTITNLDFVLNDNTPIQEDLLTVPVKVDWNETSIGNIHDASFYAYTVNNTLRIESSHKELITIYSLTGAPIYSTKKDVGLIEIPFASLPNPVFIIKGSVSGTIKVVK